MIPATTEFYDWFNGEMDVVSHEDAFNAGWSRSFEVHNARVAVSAATAAIRFALEAEDGKYWLSAWLHGKFDVCRAAWPEAPEACYARTASPQVAATQAVPEFNTALPEVPPEAWIHAMSDAGHAAGCAEWQLRAEMREAYKALRRLTTPMPDYADVEATPDEPVLDKPAKVGGVRFGKGVKWSTVIGAAQRKYEYEVTPEKEAERIEKARVLMNKFTASCDVPINKLTASCDQILGLKYRCTRCGKSGTEARRDGCVKAPCPMELVP